MKKKLMAVILSLALLIASGNTAFAADSTITISKTDANPGHTYHAFQIFAGTITDGKLVDITWGDGVDSTALIQALAVKYPDGGFTEGMSASAAAEKINALGLASTTAANPGDPAAGANELATIININLTDKSYSSTEGTDSYTISAPTGYYLVTDSTTATDSAYSLRILTLTDQSAITPKSDVPSVDKKVEKVDGTYDTTAVWSEGDVFNFQITGTIPTNYDVYSKYEYQFNDTFQQVDGKYVFDYLGSAAVTAIHSDGTSTDVTNAFTITANDDGSGLKAYTHNLKLSEVKAGDTIVLTYQAKLNVNSVIGGTGNCNTVNLTYSNNPNVDGEGETGKTPDKKAYVFTYELDVNKIDAGTKDKIAGAEFTLQRTSDSKYATIDSTGHITGWVSDEASATTVKTVAGTTLQFIGLDDGVYNLTETKAPTGYNKLTDPITFTISSTIDSTATPPTVATLKLAVGSASAVNGNTTTGIVTTDVANKSGSSLPSTGGMGSTIIILCSAMVVAVAGTILYRRRQAK